MCMFVQSDGWIYPSTDPQDQALKTSKHFNIFWIKLLEFRNCLVIYWKQWIFFFIFFYSSFFFSSSLLHSILHMISSSCNLWFILEKRDNGWEHVIYLGWFLDQAVVFLSPAVERHLCECMRSHQGCCPLKVLLFCIKLVPGFLTEMLCLIFMLKLSLASWLTRQDEIDLRSCPTGLQIAFSVFSWPSTSFLREYIVNEVITGNNRRRINTQMYPDIFYNTGRLSQGFPSSKHRGWLCNLPLSNMLNIFIHHCVSK